VRRVTEQQAFLIDLSDALGRALHDRDARALTAALLMIQRASHLLPRSRERRVVTQTSQLASRPDLSSKAATDRWLVRAERAARRLSQRCRREGGRIA
jgi:hypothetical protein